MGGRGSVWGDLRARASLGMRSRLAPVAVAGLGLALLLLQMLVARQLRSAEWSAPLERQAVAAKGFEIRADGTSIGVESPDELHALEALVELQRFRDYEIRFDVRDVRRSVTLRVDFFATRYDHESQERTLLVDRASLGRRVDLEINAGDCPAKAYLRVFYLGPPGLELGAIHFRQVSRLRSASARLVSGLGIAFLLLAAWLAIARRMLGEASPVGVEERGSGWPLVALYLAAVLGHFTVHLFAPFWRGDEIQYKAIASGIWWLGRGEVTWDRVDTPLGISTRLYPALIAPAFAAGDEFYLAVRLINALAMSAVVFPTFLIGRSYLPRSAALVVAALSALIPFANLSAYAMTEVLFYPLFMTAAWLSLESLRRPHESAWPSALGCAAALASSTRPSGLVLLPAFLACCGWIGLRSGDRAWLRAPRWLLAPAVFVPVFLGVGWLTGMHASAAPSVYAPALAERGRLLDVLLGDPKAVLDLGLGHLTTLSVPFALPLALLIASGIGGVRCAAGRPRDAELHLVAAVFWGALLALSLVFTVLVSNVDLGGLARWHSRYYFHGYPLLMLSFAAFLARSEDAAAPRGPWVWSVVGLLVAAHLWFVDARLGAHSTWFGALVDNMDVQWYRWQGGWRLPMLAGTLLVAYLWQQGTRWLRPASVAFALLWIVVANLGTAAEMRLGRRIAPDPCGRLATSFLEIHPGEFAIVSASPAFRAAAAFWIPYLPSFTVASDVAPRYLASRMAADLDYIVTDGALPADAGHELKVDAGGCRIYAVRRSP